MKKNFEEIHGRAALRLRADEMTYAEIGKVLHITAKMALAAVCWAIEEVCKNLPGDEAV